MSQREAVATLRYGLNRIFAVQFAAQDLADQRDVLGDVRLIYIDVFPDEFADLFFADDSTVVFDEYAKQINRLWR